MRDYTLNTVLRRMGDAGDEITSHGFRATFPTLANESGPRNPNTNKRALAHIESNEVRQANARGEHWEERVRKADWWADELQAYRESVER